MSHSSLAIAGVLALSLSALPVVQERASQRKKADFPTTLKAVGESWNAGRYANCLAGLRELTQMATIQRAQTIRAALPEPAGWKIEEDKGAQDALRANPILASMTASVGNIIERSYHQDGGKGRMEVTGTIDSPLVSMMSMMFANPAMLDGELITYNQHKAVLKKEGGGLVLQILIDDKHVIEVRAFGIDDDALFAIFDQAAIDRIATALQE